MKRWWVKQAIKRFVIPVLARNKAAVSIITTLATGGSWMDVVKTIARLHPAAGNSVDLIEKPALPVIRQLVDRYDGEADFAVEVLDALVEPFKKE